MNQGKPAIMVRRDAPYFLLLRQMANYWGTAALCSSHPPHWFGMPTFFVSMAPGSVMPPRPA